MISRGYDSHCNLFLFLTAYLSHLSPTLLKIILLFKLNKDGEGKSEKYDAEFRAAEKLVRKEKLNIWADPELTEKYLRLKSKWGQRGEN